MSVITLPSVPNVESKIYDMIPEKLLNEPFDTVISFTPKFDVALLEVKVKSIDESFVVEPSVTPEVVDVIAMVGCTIYIYI